MAGFIASLLAASLILFTNVTISDPWISALFLIGGLSLYLFYLFLQASSLNPLQKLQQNQTPYASDLLEKDHWNTTSGFFLSIFAIFSIYLIFDTALKNLLGLKGVLALWIALFGLGLLLLSKFDERLKKYFNPFFLIDRFYALGAKAVSSDDYNGLLNHIDALSEISCNAIERTQPSLSINALQYIRKLSKDFLSAAKSIGHTEPKEKGGQDPVIFLLFYVFQRFEMINEYAARKGFEPVISSVITSLGEMTIEAAKYDISLAIYPILETGKIATQAEKHKFAEVGDKAILTLLEAGRRILTEIDISYLELKETFFALISQIETITKEIFRQDKTASIDLLIHPFNTLLNFFKDEKVANHRDTPLIVADIKRVINEFQQLELILKTIPPLNTLEEEKDVLEKSENENINPTNP